ncbi:TonB-dependent receptor [Paucibacter sp. APW11]|uniref:TonB-dependent receptor n=1 Tax=Roseateles aquae TaxID=3077235 RepID=A0ABU3PER8_9BURK|nr:TonB-dependent receptor [Paucibacter sp. APW11]MDT9001101.1 TonB-dependent receptor [Paucibacter sp. APW11]
MFEKNVRQLAVLALCAACLPLQAQTENAKLERVEIVGSNLKRIDSEGPAPVQIVKRADIEATGATTVVDALLNLASVTGGFDGAESNSFSPGAAAVSLRGMGEKNVLVLLNGRRLANFGFASGTDSTFVDLNALPLSAIQEIQILRDGASAIYGSDAVAGVINFVTRRDYKGLELGGKYSQNTAGDLKTSSANVATGFGDLSRDGYNVLATLDLYHRGSAIAGKHEFTRSADLRSLGGQDGRSITEGPGSYYNEGTGERHAMPGCPAAQVEIDDRGDEYCRTERDPAGELSPSIKRVAGMLVGSWDLNKNVQAFGELAFSRNKADWVNGFETIEWYQPDRHILPDWGSYNAVGDGAPLTVFRAIYEAPRKQTHITADTTRLLLGMRGSLGSYDWETAISQDRGNVTLLEDNHVKRDALTQALKTGSYDPFKLRNPDAAWQPLMTSVERKASSRLSAWDAKLSNPEMFRLGGPVGLAAGLQFSSETMIDTPDAQVVARNIENLGGTGSEGGRRTRSAYVEMSLQPVKALEAQLALRSDHYSDFGGTINPKIAASFRPSESVLLRAGYNTAFKAPTLPQLHMAETVSYSSGVADWVRCKPLGLGPDRCKYTPKMLQVSNPQLKPEKSRIASFGAVFNPSKDLFLSADYYHLSQRDAIQLLDGQYLMDHEFDIAGYDKLVVRDPRNPALEARYPGLQHGRLNTIITPFMNVGRVQTDGVDLSSRYSFALGGGKLTLRDELNYQFHFKMSEVAGAEPSERLDGYYRPKWRNVFTLAYELGAWSGLLRANTSASVLNIDDPKNILEGQVVDRLPSYTTWDFNLRYAQSKQLSVNLGMVNFTDKRARFSTQYGTFIDGTYMTGPSAYLSLRYAMQ